MELSDLSVFQAVVRAGGVTRAALQLHRVQSNVTTRVKQLEEDLGVALFVREGRRMQLTAAGRVLLDYADRLLALAEEARNAVSDARPRGTLRLGAWRARPRSACRSRSTGCIEHMPTSPSSCAPAIRNSSPHSCSVASSTPRSSRSPSPIRGSSRACLRRGAGARVTGESPADRLAARRLAANAARIRAGVPAPAARGRVVRARASHARAHRRIGLVPRDPRLRGCGNGRRGDAEKRARRVRRAQPARRAWAYGALPVSAHAADLAPRRAARQGRCTRARRWKRRRETKRRAALLTSWPRDAAPVRRSGRSRARSCGRASRPRPFPSAAARAGTWDR